jgi:glycosyltransferase involved in cell wall biosynthesis
VSEAGTLRVIHLDHTSVEGGAEFTLARMLRARPTWRAVVLVPPGSGSVFQGLPVVTNGVSQPPGLSQAGAGGILGAVVRLTAQAVATRFSRWFRGADIVDANSSRSATYAALATWMSRVPLVVHLHDMIDAEALGRFGLAAMTKLVLPNADGIVSCSRATLDTAAPYLRANALTTIIPSAADLDIGHQRPPRTAGPLRIGMLARIDPWKGQLLLLEAFAQVHRDTDAVLEFAGAPLFGNERYLDQLRARTAELGLDERVTFLGQVADVPELLDRWDVAVQYSVRAEPLGQNVLQALAAGCAAIVADEGGPSEWVEDEVNGLRVPPRDPEALAATLRRLASDAQLRTRLANAAAATPGLMDNHDVMRAHAEFYDELLGRMPRRRRRPRAAASVDHQL